MTKKYVVEFSEAQINVLSNFLQLLVVAGLKIHGEGNAIPTIAQLDEVWKVIVRTRLSPTLEQLNFHEWWIEYTKTNSDWPIGGDVWMATFAAWQYAEIRAKQR